MQNGTSSLRGIVLSAAALVFLLSFSTQAQNKAASRITAAIEETRLATLSGNTHPLARPEFDRGVAPASLPMQRMLLVLTRSPQQETALETLLEQQQDAASPNLHNWLTPQQFGQQFGPSDQDIQTITAWLQSHGFQVAGVSNGRTAIEFSGTAGQVQEAFHTAIHQYAVNGELHWANSSDPQIPAALTPVVAGVNTLYNFPRQPMHKVAGVFSRTRATGAVTPASPLFTFPNPCSVTAQPFCNFAVAPADFAKIYDVPNLLLSPAPATQFNGDGVTIAIVGDSNINTSDVAQFRALFGLPAPNLHVIINGPDPGIVSGSETEADLDTQWAGAIAPNAAIDFVIAQDTEVSLGVDLAAEYAIDNNLASVLSESFGVCEFFMGTADNTFYNQLWQQAAAEGISVTVSSGDGGSAACDQNAGTQGAAQIGLSVSGFASTPYNIAVGGTDFNDVNDFATFWNMTSGDAPTTASAKSYIPEMSWNDTCTNQEIFTFFGTSTAEQTCNNAQANADGLVSVAGGSGGKSGCTVSDFSPSLFGSGNLSSCSGGYAKPAWQTALTPGDTKRDIPDLSLFASNGFNASFYLICESDLSPGTSCDPYAGISDAVGVGGTSASTPAFAGIMALINQATGSRQGNANYILYKLAAQGGNTCASAANPASTCVFYDIPSGSTIAMPCVKASANCNVSNPADSIGVLSGYATASGYDLATGLGSVNANNLITKWKNFALTASSTSLTLNSGNPVNIRHGQSVNVSIGVTGSGGTPTGNVSLIANTGSNGTDGVQGFTLSGGSASGNTNALPGGSYSVFAQYAGDGTFGSSTSSPPISVNVAPEPSQTFANLVLLGINGNVQTFGASSATYGLGFYLLRFDVADSSATASQSAGVTSNCSKGLSNCPTGAITVNSTGTPLSVSSLNLNSHGYAEIQSFSPGAYSISASYPGDASYGASSGSTNFSISKAATTTTADVAGSPVIQNNFAQIDANVETTSDGVAPTGTFTFFVDGIQLGSPTPVYESGGFNPTVPPSNPIYYAWADASAGTEFATGGTHTLSAQYSGDTNYAPSTSPAISVNVLWASTTSITSSNSNPVQGQNVTFTAQVAASQGGPPITGTVTFTEVTNSSRTALCSSVPISASGQATCGTSSLSVGSDLVFATYSGDPNYATSGSLEITETTTTAFTVTANPTTVSITAQGQSGSTTLTITAQNGFTSNGSVTITPTCSGLPSESSCSSGASVNIPANGNATATLMFATTAPSALVPVSRHYLDPSVAPGVMTVACVLCVLLMASFGSRRRWRWGALMLLLTCTVIAAAESGCGGGSSGGGGGGNPGTPTGQFNVTVSLTINGATASVPVTLSVQ